MNDERDAKKVDEPSGRRTSTSPMTDDGGDEANIRRSRTSSRRSTGPLTDGQASVIRV